MCIRDSPAGSDTGNTTIERADSLGKLLHQVTAEKSEEKRIAKNGVSHTVMSLSLIHIFLPADTRQLPMHVREEQS